ncbi:MAG: hypothetical protein WCK17_10525 [Verrucomicrobiota bacterium]
MQGSRGTDTSGTFSVTDKQFVDKPIGLDFVEIVKIRSVERFQGEFLYCPHFKDVVVEEL